jgi:hypothetical protein
MSTDVDISIEQDLSPYNDLALETALEAAQDEGIDEGIDMKDQGVDIDLDFDVVGPVCRQKRS